MTISFVKPYGAHSDCKELEYIAALHQSGQFLRNDGSIDADDVVAFLASRHGIIADKEYVEEKLMPGLAGAMDDTPEAPVFDIVELVSMLLIPHLLRAASSPSSSNVAENNNDATATADATADATATAADSSSQLLFDKVVKMILSDVNHGDVSQPAILNREFMIRVLETYGEADATLEPTVIDEMLRAAGVLTHDNDDGDGMEFTGNILMQATTGDVQKFDLHWEDSPTTHYDDALEGTTLEQPRHSGVKSLSSDNVKFVPGQEEIVDHHDDNVIVLDKNENKTVLGENDNGIEDDQEKLDHVVRKSISFMENGTQKVQRVFTFPTIDYVAENYRSKAFVIFLWVLTIVAFFAYAFQLQTGLGEQECTKFGSEFACRIVNSIISWLLIFVQLSALGTVFITLASSGNTIYLQRDLLGFIGVLLGIATITTVCFLSYVFEIHFFIINTDKQADRQYQFVYIFALVLGCILTLFQLQFLFNVVVPDRAWQFLPRPIREFLLVSEMSKAERCTKQAAAFKVNRMVNNALGHHAGKVNAYDDQAAFRSSRMKIKSDARLGSFGKAMINFQATSDFKEPCGGVIYTYKRIVSGALFREEGIWIHGRLYAMNASQWFIGVFYIVFYIVVYQWARDNIYEATSMPTTSPWPSFSPVAAPIAYGAPALAFAPAGAGSDASLSDSYVSTFQDLLAHDNVTVMEVWDNITVQYPDIMTDLAVGILNASTPEILSNVTAQLPSDVLRDFVTASTWRINLSAIVTTIDRQDISSNGGRRFLQDSGDGSSTGGLDDLIPTKTEGYLSVTIGAVAAILSTFGLAIIWIPSSVSTIMKFRTGYIGSLHDNEFKNLRVAPDLTTTLFGSAFWGVFYMSGFLFIIVGILTLFLVWNLTRPVVLILIAQLIGIAVTMAAKTIVLIFVRQSLFVGMFKKRPMGGNLMLLIFECWSLGLTVGTMAIRMIKLIVVSAFYIGRLDTPIFAPGVGNIGPVPIDSLPVQFRKDLVLHEAHRHPYMERLAVIYLLKLKHGDEFGSRAGGAWRLIFVLALMPWLRRYRLDDDLYRDDDQDDLKYDDDGNKNGIEKVENINNIILGSNGEGSANLDINNNKKTKKDDTMTMDESQLVLKQQADLDRLRKYVKHLERTMKEKLGHEMAEGVLNQIAQDITS